MTGAKLNSWLVWVVIVIAVATYHLWPYIPPVRFNFMGAERKVYYVGLGLSAMIMAFMLYINNRNVFGYVVLLAITINNVADELFFDPTEFEINEYVMLIILTIIWHTNRKIKEFDQYDQ